MTGALKSGMVSQRISSRRSVASSSSSRLEVVPSGYSPRRSSRLQRGVTLLGTTSGATSPTAVNQQVVTSLPRTQPPPAWLKLLLNIQRTSSVAVIGLVIATLAIYGWTVYVQQRWGQEYRRFESLRKEERQLISGNEALKHDIAQQAELPTSRLTVPDPNHTIFLRPAVPRSPEAADRQFSSDHPIPAKPLGY